MCFIGRFHLYSRAGLFLYVFFNLLFPCIDECDVVFDSENYNVSLTG